MLYLRHQPWLFVQLNCRVCATKLMTVQMNCSVCATSRDCLFSWIALSAQPAYLIVQLNRSVWTGLLTVCQLNCPVWTGLLTVCHLNSSVCATGLLNLWSVELLPLRDSSVLWSSYITAKSFYSKLHSPLFKHRFFNLDFCQNFLLSITVCFSVSVYISHKFRYCNHSAYYPTRFLVLLAWAKTLSSQGAIRVIECLHAG
jgi:hypothetical protein